MYRLALLLVATSVVITACSAATPKTADPTPEDPSVIMSCEAAAPNLAFASVRTSLELDVYFAAAIADFNGDGFDDILAYYGPPDGTVAEDRLRMHPMRVLASVGDGTFEYRPDLVDGVIEAYHPKVVVADFNGDGRPDLAIFDAGQYVAAESTGYGNPPQLFLSGPGGRLQSSSALSDAVEAFNAGWDGEPSGPADLHIKFATAGDIDGDGDLDIWVESTGGENVASHFMVNENATFRLDVDRAPVELLQNTRQGEVWRYDGAELVDLDGDGDLDLVLGQIRDPHPTHINQSSIVLENDGTGSFTERYKLPLPAFFDGFTSVPALTHHDVDGNGLADLILLHQRNDDVPSATEEPFTGRYIQVLVNRGGFTFADGTQQWMGDQSATLGEISNIAFPTMRDIDGDGCADLVMDRGLSGVSPASPLVYRNVGRGFRALSPEPFGTLVGPAAADVNGDGATDFVFVHQFGVVALLNETGS